MSFIDSLRSAFKGGGAGHVPLGRSFTSPWFWAQETGGARQPFDYRRDVSSAFQGNPVAQRAVRIVSEGVGNAPLSQTRLNGTALCWKMQRLASALICL